MEIKVNVHICFSSKWELVILMTMGQAYGVVGHIVRRRVGAEGRETWHGRRATVHESEKRGAAPLIPGSWEVPWV